MAEDQPEIKVSVNSPKADPSTPHSLKDRRESFGNKLGDILSITASKTLLDSDVTSLFKRDNPETNKGSDDTRLKAFGGQPFAAENQSTSLRAQPFSPQAAGKIEGQDIVLAIKASTTAIIGSLNALGGSLNSIVITQNMTNSSISKSNSLLNSLVGGINKSNLLLQNISDDVDKEKYEKPEFEKPNIGGNEPREVGPRKIEEKEHGILKELFEYETLKKAGIYIGGAILTTLTAGLPPIILKLASIVPQTQMENTAKEKDAAGDHKSAAFARTIGKSWGMIGTGAGIGFLMGGPAGALVGAGAGALSGLAEGAYEEYRRPSAEPETPIIPQPRLKNQHKGRERLGHSLHHHHKSWFDELFGVTPAEGHEIDEPQRRSAVEKANPAVERTNPNATLTSNKPVQVTSPNVVVDSKGVPSSVSVSGENITLNVNGKSFSEHFNAFLQRNLAAQMGQGTRAEAGTSGIMDKMHDFMKRNMEAQTGLTGFAKGFSEDFKEGRERAEHDMTTEGRAEARKRFMQGPLQDKIDELNKKPGEPSASVDVNQTPGLYTGGRTEAPQGIGGAGGHFGVGGITMPETPGGLGVRGIRGASGAGPAFQQFGASGGPITVQPRQGASGGGGKGGGGHAASKTEMESYIREAAKARGIDPEVALRVARSEGLNTYKGDKDSKGNYTSFGPYQLHYAGHGGGMSSKGLGDSFTKETGLDARNPNTWRQQVDYALNNAAKGGWGPWHGAARAGISSRQGLQGAHSAAVNMENPKQVAQETGGEHVSQPSPLAERPENWSKVPRQAEGMGGAGEGRFNYHPGPPDRTGKGMVDVTTDSGVSVKTSPEAAPHFQGFLNELEHAGAPIRQQGTASWNYREKRGSNSLSEHSWGNALDTNQHGMGVTDKDFAEWVRTHPKELAEAQKTWGIKSGNQFGDFGHWEWGGAEGDKVAQRKQQEQFAEKKKPTQVAKVAQTPQQPEGPKQAQATPFLSPPTTSYQVPHKDPHGTGNRIELGSSSPLPKPDSPEQIKKTNLAASEMVNKWSQNYQGSTGRSNERSGITGAAGRKDIGDDFGGLLRIKNKFPTTNSAVGGATPGSISSEGYPFTHRNVGSTYEHGSTDMRANPNLEIPMMYPRKPAEGSVDLHPGGGVPLMARGTNSKPASP